MSTAKIATMASADRENSTATDCPGPAPCPANMCANRLAASSSSRYVIEKSSQLIATASGMRATCVANNAGIDTGVIAGWLSAARLPNSANRACSGSSSRSTDESRRAGSATIAANTCCNRSINASMPSASKTSVSYSTRSPSSRPGWACTRQRVVVVFADRSVGQGQLVIARQRTAVDRVVLVGEECVEKPFVAGDSVHLAQRKILVFEGVVVGALQLIDQV